MSDSDEEIYGMGLQNSVWNFKGHSVPLLSAEGGVGRGLQPISELKGIEAGSKTASYGPALSFITNKNRAFVCESSNLGIANFTSDDIKVVYWNARLLEGSIIYGESFLSLAQSVSKSVGMMK